MNDIIGIAWYNDEGAYRRAREAFADSQNMPASFNDWKTVVQRELELIRSNGDIALRVDIDLKTFADWCASRGYKTDAQGRNAFVNHIELEYQKTGKGTIVK